MKKPPRKKYGKNRHPFRNLVARVRAYIKIPIHSIPVGYVLTSEGFIDMPTWVKVDGGEFPKIESFDSMSKLDGWE